MYAKLMGLLKKKRFEHSVGTAKTAVYLARKYKYDVKKTAVAAFLHDCTKDFTAEQTRAFVKKYGIKMDPQSEKIPALWHSYTAPYGVEKMFGIHDKEILSAVRNHTAGCAKMGVIDKMVYVADYTEYNREHKSSVKLRRMVKNSKKSLDTLVLNVLQNKLKYMIDGKKIIHISTIEMWNELSR